MPGKKIHGINSKWNSSPFCYMGQCTRGPRVFARFDNNNLGKRTIFGPKNVKFLGFMNPIGYHKKCKGQRVIV